QALPEEAFVVGVAFDLGLFPSINRQNGSISLSRLAQRSNLSISATRRSRRALELVSILNL
ncbi:hypothetical protein RYA97_02590, partial [Pseudomonas syringae group sp. 26L6]|uniref:hypothetical protein n=1 Tax=Pseudomonas syringae group sp. 26L6 TaxID=3079591 RepID=UPI00290F11C9